MYPKLLRNGLNQYSRGQLEFSVEAPLILSFSPRVRASELKNGPKKIIIVQMIKKMIEKEHTLRASTLSFVKLQIFIESK